MTSSQPRLVVVGACGMLAGAADGQQQGEGEVKDGCVPFHRRLVQHMVENYHGVGDQPGKTAVEDSSAVSAAASETRGWKITTKYYTSEVQVECWDVDALRNAMAQNVDGSALRGVEAAVFAFDLRCAPEEFPSIANVLNHFDAVETKACVAIAASDDAAALAPLQDDFVRVLMDENVEYIQVDFPFASAAAEEDADGEKSGLALEKRGLDRIVEVMETTLWSNLVRVDSQSVGAQGSVSRDTPFADFDEPLPPLSMPPPLPGAARNVTTFGAELPSLQPESGAEMSGPSGLGFGGSLQGFSSTDSFGPLSTGAGEEPLNDDFDLGNMLEEIAQVRAANSKDEVSDDERRQAAAEMAMHFASMLNLDDEAEQPAN